MGDARGANTSGASSTASAGAIGSDRCVTGCDNPDIAGFKQHFWVVDALGSDHPIPGSYLLQAAAYAGVYSTAVLSLGFASFQSMDVSR